MIKLIEAVVQIIYLILKNKFENDPLIKKEKEDLHNEAVKALKDRDVSRINIIINKLRK
jgi:hypothetical protein